MRPGLQAAIAAAHAENDGYPKGSTVICAHCFVPLYVLSRTISPGDTASRSIDAYQPITAVQLSALRRDVPSVRAALKLWSMGDVMAHVQKIQPPRTGSAAQCPSCLHCFLQVFAPSEAEVIDQAYTLRLVTIPPMSGPYPVRSSDVPFGGVH
jgi:hypothetical protein